MTFLAPAMLWSLLALIPLTAIYFLKVRPRTRPTTALFLWETILRERQATRLFQRLRDLWSLLLTALAAAAVCLALARPQWADRRQDLVLVIDVSASMAADEPGGTRIEKAKEAASEIIEGLNGVQRAAVATLGNRLTYRSHLTDNPRELLDASREIVATYQRLALDALPSPAAGQADARPGEDRFDNETEHRVILISDGCFDPAALPAGVELLRVGEPLGNVGLTAADMARTPGGENRVSFYYQAASSYPVPVEVDLTLTHLADADGGEVLYKVIPLVLEPGQNPPETFTLDNAPAGRWLARLETDALAPSDPLAADDVAYLAVAAAEPIRVAVESGDRFFLENSVLAFSQGDNLLQLVEESAQIVLSKSATPDAPRAIVFMPDGQSPWWDALGEERAIVAPRARSEDHPVLRHLDASSIAYVGARQLTPPPGAQVLVADESGLPLIYVARSGDRAAVVLNFDPAASDFYFSAWFPVIVHSSAAFLTGREHASAASYRPGQSAPLRGAERDETSVVRGPSGREIEATGQWFDAFAQPGFYEVRGDGRQQRLAASLLAASETLLDRPTREENLAELSRGHSPAYWLTVVAMVALTAESLLYQRRKVG